MRCGCENGVFVKENASGVREVYRCTCPAGERFGRSLEESEKTRFKKRGVAVHVPVPRWMRVSGRDRAAGSDD